MDAIRNCLDESLEEHSSGPRVGELDYSELRSPIDGHEQVELALGGPDLGQVDVEESDRIGVKLLSRGLVAFAIRQPADAMALQTATQARERVS